MSPPLVRLFKLAQDRAGMRSGPPRRPLNDPEIDQVDRAIAVAGLVAETATAG